MMYVASFDSRLGAKPPSSPTAVLRPVRSILSGYGILHHQCFFEADAPTGCNELLDINVVIGVLTIEIFVGNLHAIDQTYH